jgi:hypothetical protein
MNKEKIKKVKFLFWGVTVISLISIVIAIISLLVMKLKFGLVFMLLSTLMLLMSYVFEYTSLKKEYKHNTMSLSVPSLLKNGDSINPNSSKGKVFWFIKFIFPICISLVSIFALVMFYLP